MNLFFLFNELQKKQKDAQSSKLDFNGHAGDGNSNEKSNINVRIPSTGMINEGNMCFLNSTLQALFHVPTFADFLTSDNKHRELCDKNGNLRFLIS